MRLITRIRSAAIVTTLAIILPLPGCGPGTPDFDKTALYTPESLAQDLGFRFRALSPSGKISTRSRKGQTKKANVISNEERSETKAKSKEATKKAPPKTLDELLDDIELKVGHVKGISRSDVFKRMSEVVSKDSDLDETARKTITIRLNEMAGN